MDCLIVTNKRDLTSDYIVRELSMRGRSFLRLNTEDIPSLSVSASIENDTFYISHPKGPIDLNNVRSAYFRRPDAPVCERIVDPGLRHYAEMEWLSLLKSAYIHIGRRWLSHPSAILLAEDKLRQLRIARRLGFSVPPTLFSNDFAQVSGFTSAQQSVGKPLRQALITDGNEERVIFTSRIPALKECDREGISAAPAIYQAEIVKARDIRVTVVGDATFAVSIDSQSRSETEVDWRAGSFPNLAHEAISLPSIIERACVDIVKILDLRFGAIDLIEDRSGMYWFLECNPNGQWAWIENRTGLRISSAIVDELDRIALST